MSTYPGVCGLDGFEIFDNILKKLGVPKKSAYVFPVSCKFQGFVFDTIFENGTFFYDILDLHSVVVVDVQF